MEQRAKDILALLLSAPTASVAILAALAFPGGAGTVVWLGGKAWQIGLPAAWHLKVDGRERTWSKPELGGFRVAAALGVGMSVAMLGGGSCSGVSTSTENSSGARWSRMDC